MSAHSARCRRPTPTGDWSSPSSARQLPPMLRRHTHHGEGVLVPAYGVRRGWSTLCCTPIGVRLACAMTVSRGYTDSDATRLQFAREVSAMAGLSSKKREKLPAKDFGLPERAKTTKQKKESGNYPMPDEAHAKNAKARASQQRKKGRLTKSEADRIQRKADRVIEEKS
jgi:hypothetical protein